MRDLSDRKEFVREAALRVLVADVENGIRSQWLHEHDITKISNVVRGAVLYAVELDSAIESEYKDSIK